VLDIDKAVKHEDLVLRSFTQRISPTKGDQ